MLLWFIEKLLIGFLKTFSFSIKRINCYRQKYVMGVGVIGKLLEVGEVTDCGMDDRFISCHVWGYAPQSSCAPQWH
jgi:hypothetical protein